MKLKKFTLQLIREGGYAMPHPRDKSLHRLVIKWAETNLDYPLNIAEYELVRVVCRIDDNGEPIEVLALGCGGMKFDLSVARYTEPEAGKMLFEGIEEFLHDIGKRGQEVFVHLSEGGKPENVCPAREEMLKAFKAEPANRWSVIVR